MSDLINNLSFDGVNLVSKFKIVSTGARAYVAPKRDVTVISVPGRNGDVIIDNGRYENVKIVYPCVIMENFAKNFGELKNFLLNKRGYFKLSDSKDKDHYRLASFYEAIEPDVNDHNGAFELVFDCKPQRYIIEHSETAYTTVQLGVSHVSRLKDYKKTFPNVGNIAEMVFSPDEKIFMANYVVTANKTQTVKLVDANGNVLDKTFILYKTDSLMETVKSFKVGKGSMSYSFTLDENAYFIIFSAEPDGSTDIIAKVDNTVLLDTRPFFTLSEHYATPMVKVNNITGYGGIHMGIGDSFVTSRMGGNQLQYKGQTVTINGITIDGETLNVTSEPDQNNLGVTVNLNAWFDMDKAIEIKKGKNLVADYCGDGDMVVVWRYWNL